MLNRPAGGSWGGGIRPRFEKSRFFSVPNPPRLKVGTHLEHASRLLPVVLASAGALRLRRAHKRRGVRARFCDPSGRKIGYQRCQKRGPWRAERRMGRPHMPLARGHGREPALAAIACEKSDLVHVPPGLVHVRGGVKKSIFLMSSCPPDESRALPVPPGPLGSYMYEVG